MDRLAQLESQLKEEQRLRKEEQRLREEEQRLREEAEARANQAETIARPANLESFLKNCHKLSRAIKVITDNKLTTQGNVTEPAGRLYPQRIIPWDGFPEEQSKVWEQLFASPSFRSKRVFPSSHQLDYVQLNIDPIGSEIDVRIFAREVVEKQVQQLVKEVYKDEGLRNRLKLHGQVVFGSHTNLGYNDASPHTMQQMSISQPSSDDIEERGGKTKSNTWKPSRPAGRPPGKGGRADQFCIYKQSGAQSIPVAAIEYKPPHKLPLNEIVAGLREEIVLERDVIGQEDESPEALSKWLLAAVVTQCFSYMIAKGVQNGFLFTGVAVVFLSIPDDPTTVYYHVCVPNQDVLDDDPDRLLRTTVAQVTAFVLRAVAAEPPSESWFDKTTLLKVWEVEVIDILKKIPETERKEAHDGSTYNPRRWNRVHRSPIRTRSGCQPADDPRNPEGGDSDDDGDSGKDLPPTPTPQRITRSQTGAASQPRGTAHASRGGGTDVQDSTQRPPIDEREYCTHECLLGLVNGSPLDKGCPNAHSHGQKHISPKTFLSRIRLQLATDRGRNADCKALFLWGLHGALFKVRLSSSGYTLVAKAFEERGHLEHERRAYTRVSSLQGIHVPVCVGPVSLERPHHCNGGEFHHMLFFSWAGEPLSEFINPDNRSQFRERVLQALRSLHRLQVVHGDAELRNMLYDKARDHLMLIDLGRAEVRASEPLSDITPNQSRKRKWGKIQSTDTVFSNEIRAVRNHLSCYDDGRLAVELSGSALDQYLRESRARWRLKR